MKTHPPVGKPESTGPGPEACCESTLLERCCLPHEKTACCGSEPPGSGGCGCQAPALPRD